MAAGARTPEKPPSPPGKAGKVSKPAAIAESEEPAKDPNAPSPDQICGCPNTLVNAYAQNLMKLHLEDDPEPVVRRKTLGPLAMAAIEAVSNLPML